MDEPEPPGRSRPGEPPAAFPAFPIERSERIYDSPWCGLRRDMLRLPDGALQEYHVVEISDAISVVPVLPDGRMILLWQFRHPHGETHWEIPAGRIQEHEPPEVAAERELLEEAGVRAGRLQRLPGYYPINGISDHFCHVFVAHDCQAAGGTRHEPTERISTHVFERDDVARLLSEGTFQDGFTALALFHYFATSSPRGAQRPDIQGP